MEPKTKVSITDMASTGEVSVLIQTCIEYNGQEIILNNHRESLAPGQFDRAREILLDNQYNAIVELWTPEVMAAWEAKQASMNLVEE